MGLLQARPDCTNTILVGVVPRGLDYAEKNENHFDASYFPRCQVVRTIIAAADVESKVKRD